MFRSAVNTRLSTPLDVVVDKTECAVLSHGGTAMTFIRGIALSCACFVFTSVLLPLGASVGFTQTIPHEPHQPSATLVASAELGLAALEQMALQHNPTLIQAAAKLEAARGRLIQAGLYPNPTIGYVGDEIGAAGTAGQQGIFVDQVIVTGRKLRLNRAKFCQEITQAEWQALAQQYRVLNGVRMRFYEVLA